VGTNSIYLGNKNQPQIKTGFDEAIANAKQADVVVMVLGEHGLQSEGRSRSDIDLPGVQQELLEAV
jgi:beta-glucosidase